MWACPLDEWDFCRNGRYTERGIKELEYRAELWRVEPDYAIPARGRLGGFVDALHKNDDDVRVVVDLNP